MKKYILLFALAFATANNLMAMEEDDSRGQKRKGEELTEAQQQLAALPRTMDELANIDFGDFDILPNEVLLKIMTLVKTGTVPEVLSNFEKLCLVNKSFHAFVHEFIPNNEAVKNQLREQLKAELEEYRRQHAQSTEGTLATNAIVIARHLNDQAFLNQYVPILRFFSLGDMLHEQATCIIS